LRATIFGSRMEAFATCPDCGAHLELTADPRALAQRLQSEPAVAEEAGGYRMRPVNSLDLMASGQAASEEEARAILLARSLGLETHDLTLLGDASGAIAELFDRVNSSAEIRIRLECAVCSSRPVLDLDVARYLLREISAAARRLMLDIHELASAYGWSEADIVAISPARRAAYLEMLGT
jgi:hypothetical protein